jgi:hypothetical protein
MFLILETKIIVLTLEVALKNTNMHMKNLPHCLVMPKNYIVLNKSFSNHKQTLSTILIVLGVFMILLFQEGPRNLHIQNWIGDVNINIVPYN